MKPKELGFHDIDEPVSEKLRKRAERYRALTPEDLKSADGECWIAELPFADEVYALPVEFVRAVMPLRDITPIPLAPSCVLGLVRFHGGILAAFNFSSLIGVQGWNADPSVLIVVSLDANSTNLVAIDCEAIPAARTLPRRCIEAARTAGRGAVLDLVTDDLRPIRFIDDLAALIRSRLGIADED